MRRAALLVGLLLGGGGAAPVAPAALPQTCGAVMMALVRGGVTDYRHTIDIRQMAKRAGKPVKITAYTYFPALHKINLRYQVMASDGNVNDIRDVWRGVIDCKKPIRAQIAALKWPAPIPGVTPPTIEAKK